MRPLSAAAVAVIAVLLTGCGGRETSSRSTPSPPPAPGPIIGGHQPPVARDPLSPSQRRQASAAVRRFLTGYLPYLYGRASAGRVAPVTPSVAQALRSGSARVTPAQRRQHPRVGGVKVTGQTTHSALAAVQVVGAGAAPFQLTLTVERREGRWVISDLGDDG
jgi:hypothetical protein